MNKEEFLQGLQNTLSGEVPPAVVRENLNYYNDYIRTEINKGRSETEVMEELGDPRLIARTIIDITPGAGTSNYESYQTYHNGNTGGTGQYQEDHHQQGSRQNTGNLHYYNLNKWYWKLLGIVLIIVVFIVIITVVSGLLSLLIPLLLPIGMIILIMWFVRGPRR